MLGHKLFQVLNTRFEVFATFREPGGSWVHFPVFESVRPEQLIAGVDALHFDSIVATLDRVRPDVVVNAIGIVKQLAAAKDPILSISLNALFPHKLAGLCDLSGARLIHVSTDCVFSGHRGQYREPDFADAEDLYGRTKFLGEVSGPGHLTLRTSIIGRDFVRNTGLVEWFLSQRGKRILGYTRAIYSGFTTQVLSGIIADVIATHPGLSGLYHVASAPITKYDLLVRIRDAMRVDVDIQSDDSLAIDRSLDGSRFVRDTGLRIPEWDEMIASFATDTTPYDKWRDDHAVS